MGVMSCSRNGCHSIMCETYVNSVGYICNDCQKEFKQFLSAGNISAKRENEIENALKIFIETYKDTFNREDKEVDVDTFFRHRTSN